MGAHTNQINGRSVRKWSMHSLELSFVPGAHNDHLSLSLAVTVTVILVFGHIT